MHLTNFSLNKNSEKFVQPEGMNIKIDLKIMLLQMNFMMKAMHLKDYYHMYINSLLRKERI